MGATKINGATQIQNATIGNAAIASDAAIATSKLADAANFILRGASVAFTADQSMGSHKLTNLADGSSSSDAATFGQMMNLVNGKQYKDSVRLLATGNVTLTGSQTVDGVMTANGDRVACFSQSTPAQDGIYIVAAGAWTRATDFAAGSSAASATFRVQAGTANADTEWTVTNDVGSDVVNADNLALAQSGSGSTYTAGDGLALSGNTFNVGAGIGIQVNANDIEVIYGSTSGTACEGNDARLSDSRMPTSHTHTLSDITDAGSAAAASTTDFASAMHTHSLSDIMDAGSAAAADTTDFAAASHTHSASDINSGTLDSARMPYQLADGETPSGTINGSNVTFTLANTPVSGSVHLYLDGIRMDAGAGNDYTISGGTITMATAPVSGDKLRADYRY